MGNPRLRVISRVFTIANPAAGADWSFSPTSGAFAVIHSLRMQLVTSATVANRGIRLTVSKDGTEYFRTVARGTQAASLTQVYTGFKGFDGPNIVSITVPISLPVDGIWLPQGHVLASSTLNIDATDQFSGIAGYITEYPTGSDMNEWPDIHYRNAESG